MAEGSTAVTESACSIRNLIFSLTKDIVQTESEFNQFAKDHPRIVGLEHSTINKCKACRLHTTRDKSVFGSGNINARLLIIGEAPGPDEDKLGVPFIGKVGKYLREILTKIGFDIYKDIYFMNAVSCIPKDTKESSFRTPTIQEIEACNPKFQWINDGYLPNKKVTLCLGKQSYLAWHYGSKPELKEAASKITMASILGWNKDNTCYTAYHPSYIERQGRPKELTQQWINGFKEVFRKIKE